MLSILSSLYDLLGFGAPFLLTRKQILQRLCQKNLKWDTQLPEDLQTEWVKLKIKLPALQEVQIKRCFMPPDFGKVSKCSFHHFFDACTYGYCQATYSGYGHLQLSNRQMKGYTTEIYKYP